MKLTGYLLIAVSFLGGSYFAVRPPHPLPIEGADANIVPWMPFLIMLGLGALGVALARIGARAVTHEKGALTANVEILRASLDRILVNVAKLDGEKESLHPYEVHGRIDALFPEDLNLFVEARQSIAHVYGLQAYAAVMNEFAAGERYLNRVWSASVDCYIEDVHEYLGRARQQFAATRVAIEALEAKPS